MILTIGFVALFLGCLTSDYLNYKLEKEKAKNRVKIVDRISFKTWYAVVVRLKGFTPNVDPSTVTADYVYLIQANSENEAVDEAKYMAAKQCNKTNREMNRLMWVVGDVLTTQKIDALENGAYFNLQKD